MRIWVPLVFTISSSFSSFSSLKSVVVALNSFLFLFFCFLCYFSWVMALFCFSHVLLLYLRIRTIKSMWPCVSFFKKPAIIYLFISSVLAFLFNTPVVLSAVAPKLLHQWLNYLLWFKLVLVLLQISYLSPLQVRRCSIPSLKL